MTTSSPPALPYTLSPSLSLSLSTLLHPYTVEPLLYKIYQATTIVFVLCVFAKSLNIVICTDRPATLLSCHLRSASKLEREIEFNVDVERWVSEFDSTNLNSHSAYSVDKSRDK
jgi:hypothetical protein